jgi:RNA-directed DNA polymerase
LEYPRAIDPRIVNIVTITAYAHPKEAIITGKRNGLTALLYRKTAIGPYVLDDWVKWEVHPRLKGRSVLIRWDDDFIIGFEYKADVERVMKVLPKRFERYNLSLHPDKTSLVRFSKPFTKKESRESGTFDFLGFTFYWRKGLKGYWVIKKRMARKRLYRFMKRIG